MFIPAGDALQLPGGNFQFSQPTCKQQSMSHLQLNSLLIFWQRLETFLIYCSNLDLLTVATLHADMAQAIIRYSSHLSHNGQIVHVSVCLSPPLSPFVVHGRGS